MFRKILTRIPSVCLALLSTFTIYNLTAPQPQIHAAAELQAHQDLVAYEVPEGDWVSADSCWAFRSDGPLKLDEFTAPAAPFEDLDNVSDADRQVMHLVRCYMQPTSTKDNRTLWNSKNCKFHGEAISVKVNDEDVPVLAWIASPAGELWTIMMARRIGKVQASFLPLPHKWSLEATRLSDKTARHCQLLSTEGSVSEAADWFRTNDCVVSPPLTIEDRTVMEVFHADHQYSLTFLQPAADGRLALLQCVTP